MPVGPTAKMALLQYGLREFGGKARGNLPEVHPRFTSSSATPAFDNLISPPVELLDHFGKIWLVTNYHDAVGVGLGDPGRAIVRR